MAMDQRHLRINDRELLINVIVLADFFNFFCFRLDAILTDAIQCTRTNDADCPEQHECAGCN